MTDRGCNDEEVYLHRELTDVIICCFYTVYNTLGFGFLEKVYENALLVEFRKRNIVATAQSPISVFYGEVLIGREPMGSGLTFEGTYGVRIDIWTFVLILECLIHAQWEKDCLNCVLNPQKELLAYSTAQ